MTSICPVCQYPAKSEAVLTAHRKFQHEGGDPVNPDQPTLKTPKVRIISGGDFSPATPEAVVFTDEPRVPSPAVVARAKAKRAKKDEPLTLGRPAPVEVIPPTQSFDSRESWLNAAVKAMTPWVEETGNEVPPVRVSIGWPGGRSDQTVLGSCWAKTSVKDGVAAIFVSPVQDDPTEVLETVLHEMIHAVNHEWAHRAPFQKVGKALGFTNGAAVKTTRAESPDLYARLDTLAASLGSFPHAAINTHRSISGGTITRKDGTVVPINPRTGNPVQGTRMLKVACPEDGYTVRTTARWLAVGNPSCPDGHEMVAVQS